MKIALANDHRTINPALKTDYIRQILAEDTYLVDAFDALGAETCRVDWSDASIDWSQFDAVLIRQTWDYFQRFDEFMAWLDRIEHLTQVINPVPVMRWNADKRYLIELADLDLPVVPTMRIERTDRAPDLGRLMQAADLDIAVIKPAVSGAGRETWRIERAHAAEHQARWQALVAKEDMLFQPFMPAIVQSGEVSLIVIAGEVTHAVRKTAASGEFRVQDDHGGTVHPHQASALEIQIAEQAIAAVAGIVAYARVDLVESATGPLLMELELIEPELFFRNRPESAAKLAELVHRQILSEQGKSQAK